MPDRPQTPTSQTPTGSGWTVDKIANSLSSLVQAVGRNHGRLVEFLIEELDKKKPEAVQLAQFDDFADMKPKTAENGFLPDPPVETMAVKFKVRSKCFPEATKSD
jgi:hypothetical protein